MEVTVDTSDNLDPKEQKRADERAGDPRWAGRGDKWLEPAASVDPSNRDPKTGRLLPGHRIAGPGRPKGSLDFMSICRTKAKEAGVTLEDLVWAATKGIAGKAAMGDAAAAKILLDRLCGSVDKAAVVSVDARSITAKAGPPIPKGGDFADWVTDLNRVAAKQGLLGSKSPADIVDAAVAQVTEAEELLS